MTKHDLYCSDIHVYLIQVSLVTRSPSACAEERWLAESRFHVPSKASLKPNDFQSASFPGRELVLSLLYHHAGHGWSKCFLKRQLETYTTRPNILNLSAGYQLKGDVRPACQNPQSKHLHLSPTMYRRSGSGAIIHLHVGTHSQTRLSPTHTKHLQKGAADKGEGSRCGPLQWIHLRLWQWIKAPHIHDQGWWEQHTPPHPRIK